MTTPDGDSEGEARERRLGDKRTRRAPPFYVFLAF